MSTGALIRTTAVVFMGACLAFSHAALAQDDDLDKLSEQELREALAAELDDVLADKSPPETEEALVAAFETALHDEGDEGDKAESLISWSELVAEMTEAKTTVHAVVAAAVHESLEGGSDEEPEQPEGPGEEHAPDEQSIGLDRIKRAYHGVLASLFATIDKF